MWTHLFIHALKNYLLRQPIHNTIQNYKGKCNAEEYKNR